MDNCLFTVKIYCKDHHLNQAGKLFVAVGRCVVIVSEVFFASAVTQGVNDIVFFVRLDKEVDLIRREEPAGIPGHCFYHSFIIPVVQSGNIDAVGKMHPLRVSHILRVMHGCVRIWNMMIEDDISIGAQWREILSEEISID